MALINLTTDLKSLKYGQDRPGGGSSNQPYIVNSITPDESGPLLDVNVNFQTNALANQYGYNITADTSPVPQSGTGGPDFLIRGGTLFPKIVFKDVARLSKYFVDTKSPRGLLFTVSQNLLSRTAVKTQTSGLLNEGIYTPLSTLAQAGVSIFGAHLNKQGLNPFAETGAYATNNDNLYEVKMKQDISFFNNGGLAIGDPTFTNDGNAGTISIGAFRNRLLLLYGTKIVPNGYRLQGNAPETSLVGDTTVPGASPTYDSLQSLAKKNSVSLESGFESNILEYPGGPGSILGIGKTQIRFADQRTGVWNYNIYSTGFLVPTTETGFSPEYAVTLEGNPNIYKTKLKPKYVQILSKTKLLDFLGYTSKFPAKFGKPTPFSVLVGYTKEKILVTPAQPGVSLLNVDPTTGLTPEQTVFTGEYTYDYSVFTRPRILKINGNKLLGLSKYSDYLSSDEGTGFSIYGDIDSTIRNVGRLEVIDKTQFADPDANVSLNLSKGYVSFTQEDFVDITGVNYAGRTGNTTAYEDFRSYLRNFSTDAGIISSTSTSSLLQQIGNLALAPDYSNKNIETRVDLGDPGNRNQKNLTSYTSGSFANSQALSPYGAASYNSYDKVTYLPIYKSGKQDPNDLVKFRIKTADNVIAFRAFLDQISDQYSSDWDPFQYIGRGEKFYTYKGFDRQLSLSWTVAAQSKVELIPMYKKLNYLASMCAPKYGTEGYMSGNIVYLTIGDYIKDQAGLIKGFSYEMNDENATWEIKINDNGDPDSSVGELPHLIKVTGFQFIPIHSFVPKLQDIVPQPALSGFDDFNGYGTEKYIASGPFRR